MPEDGPDRREGGPLPEHVRGGGMPEHMRAVARALNVGPLERLGGNLGDGFRTERRNWGSSGEKNEGARDAGPLMFGIGEEGLANLLGQWKAGSPPRLPRHAERPVEPIDIPSLQGRYIASAEP
jgi:hypothetical protein